MQRALPVLAGLAAFALVFAEPFALLVRDWWSEPEAGHGLLLGPLSVWLAWRARTGKAAGNAPIGIAILIGAVSLRYGASLAAELFTMRLSMVIALAALTVFYLGARQLVRWWLPFVLLVLSIPLPELVLGTIALPLQFKASALGAAMLDARHVPVQLAGNVIRLPGQELFVTEACSGLRSLTALISLGVLLSATMLDKPLSRAMLILAALPIAIVVNGVRVFVTGFAVYHIGPEAGRGFLHLTEGWLMFIVALLGLAGAGYLLGQIEKRVTATARPDA